MRASRANCAPSHLHACACAVRGAWCECLPHAPAARAPFVPEEQTGRRPSSLVSWLMTHDLAPQSTVLCCICWWLFVYVSCPRGATALPLDLTGLSGALSSVRLVLTIESLGCIACRRASIILTSPAPVARMKPWRASCAQVNTTVLYRYTTRFVIVH